MSGRIRKHLLLEPGVLADLTDLLSRRRDSNLSNEVNAALKEYLQRQKAGEEALVFAPVLERLLNMKMDQQELWLRSGVWAGATYSATATLLLLELLCGQRVDPQEAKAHLDLIRGRAWKMVRKGPDWDKGT